MASCQPGASATAARVPTHLAHATSPQHPQKQQRQACGIAIAITATTVDAFLAEIAEAEAAGADIVELRLDFIEGFRTETDLQRLMAACTKPFIVTYRPIWEGGKYSGPEAARLATLKFAALLGAPYIDVEFKAAQVFFAEAGEVPVSTRVILSSHNFQSTPSREELHAKAADMLAAGADIIKIATFANDICDAATVLSLLQNPIGPTIALAMGEKGVITRLLAAKYGAHLTFATMSSERASAPGQPDVALLRRLFNFSAQGPATRLYGIIGNPVAQSRSPLVHNTAFQHLGYDGVYVPLLVDDLPRFLDAFQGHDFDGFSVTIPHKGAALAAAAEVDPVAAQIGAVNTLIRLPGGGYKGFNTDWSAAIGAIERKVAEVSGASGGDNAQAGTSGRDAAGGDEEAASALHGKCVVIIGAGGAARALAFGAVARGAHVVIANRSRQRAEELVAALPAGVATVRGWDELCSGAVSGDVLANSTSVGMHPNEDVSPVPAAVAGQFPVVFDAVYNPLWTLLLRDARDAGCATVDGLQMFVGQAVDQLEMFAAGHKAPRELMARVVLDSMAAAAAASPAPAQAVKA